MKPNPIFEAAVVEVKRLARIVDATNGAANKAAFDEIQRFTKACMDAATDVQNEKESRESGVPSEIRKGYTVRTHKRGGQTWRVLEIHKADGDAPSEATPLTVFENLKPEQMDDVVILMRDFKGQTAVTSNMNEPGDILLFMEILKTKLLNAMADGPMCDTPSLDPA